MAHFHHVELVYGTPASGQSSLSLPEPDEAGTHSHQVVWTRGQLAPYQGHYHKLGGDELESGPAEIAQIEQYREEAAIE